jgi:hypothetical protein
LIRDLVDGKEEEEWFRDPKGTKFSEYVIKPILTHLNNYLSECLDYDTDVSDDSDSSDDTEESETDCEKMRRSGRITGTKLTLGSKKFKQDLLSYIGANVSLHKSENPEKKSSKPEKKSKKPEKKSKKPEKK